MTLRNPGRPEGRDPRVPLRIACSFLLSAACASHFEARHPGGKLARSGELSSGDQEGPWTYYYPSGVKQAEGAYQDDVQVGPWTYWYESGQTEMEGDFVDERRAGSWTFWHETGALRARGSFEQGLESGEWVFHAPDGRLERRGPFDEGRQTLGWTFFHPDGSRAAEGFYWEGAKVDRWRYWSASGEASERTYPLPDGLELCLEHWESGGLRRAGFRHAGLPDGLWASWNEDGELRMEARFESGELSGPACAWRAAGAPFARGRVARGRLVGQLRVEGERAAELAAAGARPPAVWSGAWSDASLVEHASPAHVFETWLAELGSPLEPVPVAVTEPPGSAVPAALEHETSVPPTVPVRAQPWTERELRELPRYVENYADGPQAGQLSSSRYDNPFATDEPARRPEGDEQKSRALLGRRLSVTRLPTAGGEVLDLARPGGAKNVLLTVMRGFGGQVCVYCAAQTKALARSARDFERLETEVVVVYPGPQAGLDAFLEAYARTFGGERPPYRVVYDPGLELTRSLGILDNLARPTSLILDPTGVVRYAYVGRNIEDRPPTHALVERLERLE